MAEKYFLLKENTYKKKIKIENKPLKIIYINY